MKKIGTAVVGYGYMGVYHCNQIIQVEGLRLQAVCDSDPGRRVEAEKNYGIKTYISLNEALKDPEVELVVIVTPNHIHAALALQALSAGRHVVVEKPMCLNLREADTMIEAARTARRTLTVYQNRRHDTDYLTARQVMKSGVLGDVYRIEAACNYCGPAKGWRTQASFGGGYLYDMGSHLIDQLVQLAGCRAKTVFADLQRSGWGDTMDTETYANLTVRFEKGLVGVIDVSGIARYRKPRFLIMGGKGAYLAIADEEFGKASGFIHTNVSDPSVKVEAELIKGDWRDYYQQLADHLLEGSELQVKPEEVRETVKIIEGAFQSSEKGQSIEVLDW